MPVVCRPYHPWVNRRQAIHKPALGNRCRRDTQAQAQQPPPPVSSLVPFLVSQAPFRISLLLIRVRLLPILVSNRAAIQVA